ncbi:cbb3-type cytochrome c oxidase subunit I [Paenibacillus eucommiae]|uniref:Cbb3-type cytochrome oxidase subunit 1 n=1 Tax=Paenibacillus eucommiae TaxID=1355755 RepID=A0ABS4IX91_9BACL|nr:cbb3-type cytochrome c oxidase subunit I [Paenibacillus eucommiae]MBP1992143.1 cbb3-type cytochrome oxidase subunit 1 [Paenibacillus eucommiae]
MGKSFIKIASVYFFVGVTLGMVMGITESFQFTSDHAHINLLGWVSMALFGLIYHCFPQTANQKLAKVHFWLHNVGVPVMVAGHFIFVLVSESAGLPIMASGGFIVVVATLIFLINIFMTLNKPQNA